jgi:glycosyltransferase involved in cell wall biosynthesis
MLHIFDCSNSSERPTHRGNGGPHTNDIIRYLKENAHLFECSFVEKVSQADVLLTNDVFPKALTKLPLPKVKRMDGVFFQEDLEERNHTLNESAQLADHVIFISEFSKRSCFDLYGTALKKHSVVRNQADPKVFRPSDQPPKELKTFIASATDWSRPEKRLDAILEFAAIYPEYLFKLMGTSPKDLPSNIVFLDYFQSPQAIAQEMKRADAMICFAYKDACPKTVVQGVACGLSVLYADSGGLPEIVFSGVAVPDKQEICFEVEQPKLKTVDLIKAGQKFAAEFPTLKEKALLVENDFYDMLDGYFKVLKSF